MRYLIPFNYGADGTDARLERRFKSDMRPGWVYCIIWRNFLYVHWIFLSRSPLADGVQQGYLEGSQLDQVQRWYLP